MKKYGLLILVISLTLSLISCTREVVSAEPTHFDNGMVSLDYNADILELQHSTEEESFILALTKRGEDTASVPRVDVFSVHVDTMPNEETLLVEFEYYSISLLSVYYGEDLPEIIFEGTGYEFEAKERNAAEYVYTTARLDAAAGLPAMVADIAVLCDETGYGACAICLRQDGLDAESCEILSEIMKSVKLSAEKQEN